MTIGFWIAGFVTLTVYNSIFSFSNVAEEYIELRFALEHEAASLIISIPMIICATTSPLIGLFVDYYGKRVFLSNLFLLLQVE
jgi:MFS family permease